MVQLKEIWKAIEDYEGYYEISNYGNVRSLDRVVGGKNGHTKSLSGRLINICIGSHGYSTARICINSNAKTKTIHRLVAIHFLDKIEGKDYVNHIDGNKQNNHVSNLEWCTCSENTIHGLSLGIMNTAKGCQKPNTKLNEDSVRDIKIRLKNGEMMTEIAIMYDVHKSTINEISRGRNWKHVKI